MRDEIPSRGVPRRAVVVGMTAQADLPVAGRAAATGGEAPALAQLAKHGKLPALAEWLAKTPMVVAPFVKIGTYSRILHHGLRAWSDYNRILRMAGNQAGYDKNDGNELRLRQAI